MAYSSISKPSLHFDTKLYTGNSGTQSITSLDFQPDWCWFKARNNTDTHAFFDSVRGVTKRIIPDNNSAEGTQSNGLTHFLSNGFTVGDAGIVNQGYNYVAWNWKESATAGFDICSWTGNGSAQNISHNLSKVPTMIIVKNRTDSGADWYCYNVHNGNTHSILLNTSGAKVGAYSDNWNNTTPTSSVFTVGSSNSTGGSSGDNMIAYVFTDIQGYSKFGTYTGNGNADGAFIFTGFKPAWVLCKTSSISGEDWIVSDNKRNPFNETTTALFPNSASGDQSSNSIDMLSNGFKMRTTGTYRNQSGVTYIYMAFAEAPFVNSSGVPNNAR